MSKKWIWLLGLVCCTVIAGLVTAEGNKLSRAEYGMEWDAAAFERMSAEEKVVFQQAYRAKLEAAALRRGWQPEKREFSPAGRQASAPSRALGSITYHSGTLGTCCMDSHWIGNQFNSALNPAMTHIAPVQMSGSITMATFDMIQVAPANVFLSFYHLRAGATAPRIGGSILTPATTGINTKTFAPAINYSGSSFLAGVWQFTPDSPAVATGTTGGQGYHGLSGNDGAVLTTIVDLTALNAAFTAGGNVLTPLELLSFEIED